MSSMSLKPITVVAAAGGITLAVLAQDVVAACQRASNDPANQCSKIPDAVEFLTVIASAASDESPMDEALLDVKDERTGIINYGVVVPAHEHDAPEEASG